MELLKIDPKKSDKKPIVKAAKAMENGGLVVYPTDTLYAIGANATDEHAIMKVFEAKGRSFDKPVSVAVRDLEQAKRYFDFNRLAERIVKRFLPGPLTIILPSKVLPKALSPSGKFSFRIPDNKIALNILRMVDFPITATSANVSGWEEPTSAGIAVKQIGSKVDVVLDAGKCVYGRPSTVVDFSEGKMIVVREGVVSKSELFSFCKV